MYYSLFCGWRLGWRFFNPLDCSRVSMRKRLLPNASTVEVSPYWLCPDDSAVQFVSTQWHYHQLLAKISTVGYSQIHSFTLVFTMSSYSTMYTNQLARASMTSAPVQEATVDTLTKNTHPCRIWRPIGDYKVFRTLGWHHTSSTETCCFSPILFVFCFVFFWVFGYYRLPFFWHWIEFLSLLKLQNSYVD